MTTLEHDGAASLRVAKRLPNIQRWPCGSPVLDWVGWYVVRICPCHFGQRITRQFASRALAEKALRACDADARQWAGRM